jgi:hypothetical protein
MGLSCDGCPNDKPEHPRIFWPDLQRPTDYEMVKHVTFLKMKIEEIMEILERWKPC